MRRVLIIEPDRKYRQYIREHCEREGFETQEFENTDEAWEVVGDFKPDLVFADIDTIGGVGRSMAGADLIHRLKSGQRERPP